MERPRAATLCQTSPQAPPDRGDNVSGPHEQHRCHHGKEEQADSVMEPGEKRIEGRSATGAEVGLMKLHPVPGSDDKECGEVPRRSPSASTDAAREAEG